MVAVDLLAVVDLVPGVLVAVVCSIAVLSADCFLAVVGSWIVCSVVDFVDNYPQLFFDLFSFVS